MEDLEKAVDRGQREAPTEDIEARRKEQLAETAKAAGMTPKELNELKYEHTEDTRRYSGVVDGKSVEIEVTYIQEYEATRTPVTTATVDGHVLDRKEAEKLEYRVRQAVNDRDRHNDSADSSTIRAINKAIDAQPESVAYMERLKGGQNEKMNVPEGYNRQEYLQQAKKRALAELAKGIPGNAPSMRQACRSAVILMLDLLEQDPGRGRENKDMIQATGSFYLDDPELDSEKARYFIEGFN